MVLLDASAVIHLLEGDGAARRSVQRVLVDFEGSEPPALAVSALSRLECRVKPLRERNADLLQMYEAFFADPGLLVIDLDATVLEVATELRARYRLRTPDAIQAASLLAHDRDGVFVTSDTDFSRIEGLQVRTA